ncbi:MAG: Lrp/AsnC family transcriptional regulator [Pseudomonadales bacterium]|nr:Lrp/AsnC family transcriptional regulator [Pseudomonadales bacterium]MCP5216459.1 Lrp/AsnC family transcriptional regulator [Pseudomonadales bacterium]
MKLDSTDRKILRALQNDGRLSNSELAERINLSPSACLRRVKQLEEQGVIAGYVMLVNPAAIGRPTIIFVEITLNSQSVQCQEAFEAAVRKNPEIMECYLMTGEADYLLRVAAGGTSDYERLHKNHLSNLPGVARIKTAFGIRTVCTSTAYPID